MPQPTISIIVPVYNVEPYLRKCIDSILAQTFKDFELILIDDGSPDQSGVILDEYAKKDSRTRVIHKENGGVSSARNAGIDIAQGEFIAFVDPDDTIDKNMYKILYDSILHFQVDIVVCPIKIINTINNDSRASSVWKETNSRINKDTIKNKIIPELLSGRTYNLYSCVNKLYKRSIFDELNIRFDENKHHGEDVRMNFILLTFIKDLVFIEKPLYNYFIRKRDSLTKVFRGDLYDYALDNKKFMISLCEEYGVNIYINSIRNHFTTVTLMHMQDVITRDIQIEKKRKIISRILNDKEFHVDIMKYKCPSLFYSLLKVICIRKYTRLLFGIVKAKIKMQLLLHREV